MPSISLGFSATLPPDVSAIPREIPEVSIDSGLCEESGIKNGDLIKVTREDSKTVWIRKTEIPEENDVYRVRIFYEEE